MFSKIKPQYIVFYGLLLVVVVFLAYPIFFVDFFEEYLSPRVDKMAMSWLHERGLEFSEAEKKESKESSKNE